MARARRTTGHEDLGLKGLALEWEFSPWRRPHFGDTEILRPEPVLRAGETLVNAFAADPNERKQLAQLLPQLRSYRHFFNKCFNTCLIYQVDLQRRTMPRMPQSRARLEGLTSAIAKARGAYERLHSTEIGILADVASNEPKAGWPWVHLEPRQFDVSPRGRVEHALEMMGRVEAWANEAVGELSASKGRPQGRERIAETQRERWRCWTRMKTKQDASLMAGVLTTNDDQRPALNCHFEKGARPCESSTPTTSA